MSATTPKLTASTASALRPDEQHQAHCMDGICRHRRAVMGLFTEGEVSQSMVAFWRQPPPECVAHYRQSALCQNVPLNGGSNEGTSLSGSLECNRGRTAVLSFGG